MRAAESTAWANPSSPHGPGRAAAAALDQARAAVAALADWDPRGVVFTSGASEANALALTGRRAPEGALRLVSAVEHPSVLAWADLLIPVDGQGQVDLEALEALLSIHGPRIAVVSVMAANNETGVLQPMGEVAAACQKHQVLLHCDASQLPGRLPVQIPADLITLSSHKMGGPRGAGALLILPALMAAFQAQIRGGPQERGLRGGTENVPAIAGMGEAARLAGRTDPGPRDQLEAACLRLGGRVLGSEAPRLPNTCAVLFPHPGDLVVMGLDLEGVSASTGSACASGAAEPSHVLAAMGLSGVPVRFSFGPDATEPSEAIAALERVLARMEGM